MHDADDGTRRGDVTRMPVSPRTPRSGSAAGWLSDADGISHGLFAPGAVLAERYRIIALLGKGGMGEVYRADDLKLGQAVALKFLPPDLAHDAHRLARFHSEVRLTRQISHPNVCRVYDVAEIGLSTFLSMEYVDGEDLASLLRRIGRLPEDKALEIARQLCAGVSAAHDRGVLHRDLKPANVMIDGRGNVRVMDFGLAVAAGTSDVEHAGTPAYMAPEQLAGRDVSVQSDLYAVGLILYEMVTGRRALTAPSLGELVKLHESGALTRPTEIVPTLDPAIERAILRCLERRPEARPQSALAVSAALPGGDPLAAALAAGETPSPAMVAAAGREDALPAPIALGAVVAIALMLVAVPFVTDRTLLVHAIADPKATDVLVDRAETIRAALGYAGSPYDRFYDFAEDRDFVRHVAETDRGAARWERLRSGRATPIYFWYRTSPDDLVRETPGRMPTWTDPPFTVPGMTALLADTQGRLLDFRAVPPLVEGDADAAAPDWRVLFAAADLPFEAFSPVSPQWTPSTYADTRAAWEGFLPEDPGVRLRVEAAAYHGKPVFFRVIYPWTRAGDPEEPVARTVDTAASLLVTAILLALLCGAAWLARRHLRRGRSDRRGADRLALAMVALGAATWLVGAHHLSDLGNEVDSFFTYVALSLFGGAVAWLLYLALEPLVRKWQPRALVGWTRLMSGSFRDPEVGRDLLAGVAAGVLLTLLCSPRPFMAVLLGAPPDPPTSTATAPLLGLRHTIAGMLSLVSGSMQSGMLALFAFVVARLILRRTSVTVAAAIAFSTAIKWTELAGSGVSAAQLLLVVPSIAVVVAVIVRFGLLATVVTFYVWTLLEGLPLTTDSSLRHFGASTAVLLFVFGLGVLGAYAARAGQPLMRFADD